MKLWSIAVYSGMSLHSIFILDIPNMIYYLKVVTFKKWTKDSFPHNLLTSCWKSLMWIAELSDVFNRCQAVMNTAGSKVVRNWASSRCWRSKVKPRGSEGVTRHLQRGWRGVSDALWTLWHVWHNRGGGPKWWALGWVIDITAQSQEGPLLSADSLNETFYIHDTCGSGDLLRSYMSYIYL